MEEDNASDVFRSMSAGGCDCEGTLGVTRDGRDFAASVRLRGNLLAVQAIDEPVEPLVYVLERCQVRKLEDEEGGFAFVLVFSNDELKLIARTAPEREQWMVAIATSSHQMAQAELDELQYKLFTMSHVSPTSIGNVLGTNSLIPFFLTAPVYATHTFTVPQQRRGDLARCIIYDEVVYESKMSLSLALEFSKLFRLWVAETRTQLEAFLPKCPPLDIPTLHEMIRQTRDTAETFDQTWEFLSTYSGPSFRKSVEKRRVAFAPVPTNLHVHMFGSRDGDRRHVLTAGVAAALPLRFQNGGLAKMRQTLPIHPAYNEHAFSAKRQELVEVKKLIGNLAHKMEVEWKMKEFGKPDQICVQLHEGIKQAHARLRDVSSSLPGVDRHVDALVEQRAVQESLCNQLDNLDALLVSLHTKVAVLDSLDDSPIERSSYEKSARDTMGHALDSLLDLANCLLDAQLLGRLRSLSRTADCHVYTHLCMRMDMVLSQAAIMGGTAILARLTVHWPMTGDKPADLLFLVWSWLSSYGDERGMIEDATEAWKALSTRVLYKLVRAPSSVCQSVTPLVSGHRHCVIVSLPLPQPFYDSLPSSLRSVEYLRIQTSFWNLGVNHEATMGQQFGGVSHEAAINAAAYSALVAYAETRTPLPAATEAIHELETAMSVDSSRKNMSLFEWAMAATRALDGEALISCKSGKDRTAMGVTLEQGRELRQNNGLTLIQAQQVVDALRRNGARREVCRKNVGKAAYSFSAFQMHFLPRTLRPPPGTFAHGLST